MNLLSQISDLHFPADLPPTLLRVTQRFDRPLVGDIPAAAHAAVEQSGLLAVAQPGDSVAVGVGSRGIANQPQVLRAVIERLREAKLQPFITPAMGSHAGATVDGQIEMLANLGVTRETVGANVRATMEVQEIGRLPDGPAIFQDGVTAAADHVLLVNRVKPHTSFRGDIESGLAKMAVVGLGKQRGAAALHAGGPAWLTRHIAPAAKLYAERTNLRGGIALIENGYDETAEIVGLTAGEIGDARERALLARAKSLMPSLPFPEIEVLVLREIGKNISGTGMDTNIVGRVRIPRQSDEAFGGPDIAVIAVLDLTEATHGNAYGIGLANVTTARVAARIDWRAVYTNAGTSGMLGMLRAHLPLTMADDQRALQMAARGCGYPAEQARWVFIENTLSLGELWVSESLRGEVEAHERLSIEGEVALEFGEDGAMRKPWTLV